MDVFHDGTGSLSVISQWCYKMYPSFFVVMTIGLHQVTGVLIGTRAIIPLTTFWSKQALICYFQLYMTGIGVCHVYGTASGLR